MNPLIQALGMASGGSGASKTALFIKAFQAASRGESAEAFLVGLAKSDPRFQGIDFSNLEKTAHQLCQQKGVDEGQLIDQIKNEVSQLPT